MSFLFIICFLTIVFGGAAIVQKLININNGEPNAPIWKHCDMD